MIFNTVQGYEYILISFSANLGHLNPTKPTYDSGQDTSMFLSLASIILWLHRPLTLGKTQIAVQSCNALEIRVLIHSNPHFRAIEECFFAYNWMLQNLASLGTNGKFILVGGDSAGGNFAMGLTYLCIKEGIRAPDNLVLMYPSLLCEMYPSPSRLVCLFDPLVMFPFLLRCLNSYADQDYKSNRTFLQELEGCKTYNDPLLSPLIIPDEMLAKFPPVNLFTTDIDPCLDEVITLSNRLVNVGNSVSLEVIQGLPHGFLSLNAVSTLAQESVEDIGKKLMRLFQQRSTSSTCT